MVPQGVQVQVLLCAPFSFKISPAGSKARKTKTCQASARRRSHQTSSKAPVTSNTAVGGLGTVMLTVQSFNVLMPPDDMSARNNVQFPLGFVPVKELQGRAGRGWCQRATDRWPDQSPVRPRPTPRSTGRNRSGCRKNFDRNGCRCRRVAKVMSNPVSL